MLINFVKTSSNPKLFVVIIDSIDSLWLKNYMKNFIMWIKLISCSIFLRLWHKKDQCYEIFLLGCFREWNFVKNSWVKMSKKQKTYKTKRNVLSYYIRLFHENNYTSLRINISPINTKLTGEQLVYRQTNALMTFVKLRIIVVSDTFVIGLS